VEANKFHAKEARYFLHFSNSIFAENISDFWISYVLEEREAVFWSMSMYTGHEKPKFNTIWCKFHLPSDVDVYVIMRYRIMKLHIRRVWDTARALFNLCSDVRARSWFTLCLCNLDFWVSVRVGLLNQISSYTDFVQSNDANESPQFRIDFCWPRFHFQGRADQKAFTAKAKINSSLHLSLRIKMH